MAVDFIVVGNIEGFSVFNVIVALILCVTLSLLPLFLRRIRRLPLVPMAQGSVIGCINEMSGPNSPEYILNLSRTMKKVLLLIYFLFSFMYLLVFI